MLARLPSDKIQKISNLLFTFKQKRSVTLRELQSLVGLLIFACTIIIPGRAFLRRLIDLTIGHSSPQYRINLNAESRADLRAWHEFIENFNCKLCFLFDAWISSDTLRLYSDAAGVHGGYAAVFGSNWFTGEWPPAMQPFHLTIKEFFPIVLAVEIWGNVLTNHKILFFTDNAAVVDIINNTTSKDKVIMKLVRRLVLAALKYNIFFLELSIFQENITLCVTFSLDFHFRKLAL